jgi:hypothetical protein
VGQSTNIIAVFVYQPSRHGGSSQRTIDGCGNLKFKSQKVKRSNDTKKTTRDPSFLLADERFYMVTPFREHHVGCIIVAFIIISTGEYNNATTHDHHRYEDGRHE